VPVAPTVVFVDRRPGDLAHWWAWALGGLGFGVPAAIAVASLTHEASDPFFGTLQVFLIFGPLVVCGMTLASAGVIWLGRLQWSSWWWVVALPATLSLILFWGARLSGPSSSVPERAAGWALVTAVVYVGVAVAFGRHTSGWWVRCLAVAVVVAAAPAMVFYDHASQLRWRKADLAGAALVLPVIPQFRAAAVRATPRGLSVDMTGPAYLFVLIRRCTDCALRHELRNGVLVVVDGNYQIQVTQADDGVDRLAALTSVAVRPVSRDELARLPVAPDRYPDSD
jgi:hypothetical protein